MKKLLVLMLVLGMTPMANAELQISVNGDTDPTDFEYTINLGGELVLGVWTDADINFIYFDFTFYLNNQYDGWALVAEAAGASISGGVSLYPADPGVRIYDDARGTLLMPLPGAENGVGGTVLLAGPTNVIAAGATIFDEIVFHGEAPGDVVLKIYKTVDYSAFTLEDSVIISIDYPCFVPNVLGQTQAAATAAITYAGLVVGTVNIVDGLPRDNVVWQNPAGLTQVDCGSAVDIDVTAASEDFTVVDPNGGETMVAGQTYAIQWETGSLVENIAVTYSLDNGQAWTPVEPPNAGNTGTYDWTVPNVTSDQCLICISDASDPDVNDISDDVFRIYVCTLVYDLNHDCFVDFFDFSILASEWMQCGDPCDPICQP